MAVLFVVRSLGAEDHRHSQPGLFAQRMDDAKENSARWGLLPAPGGGQAVNRPATSCRDPSNCFGRDRSFCHWLPRRALTPAVAVEGADCGC